MNVKQEIQKTIQVLKQMRKFKSQAEIAEYLHYNPSYFSRALNSDDIPMDLEQVFFKAFPRSVYLKAAEPDKKTEALQQLSKVQNGKQKNSAEGRMVPDEEVIQIKTYLIPIKGFAGLKNALFDDIYISENFDQTTTEVPKEYYASTSYKIQSTGQSMPLTIPEGAWVTGVPIPQMDWLGYKFREDKVYVLFHHIKGILFKRVKNIPHGNIRLMSENPDKEEYPDEDFDIREFKKICIAIKVETFI